MKKFFEDMNNDPALASFRPGNKSVTAEKRNIRLASNEGND